MPARSGGSWNRIVPRPLRDLNQALVAEALFRARPATTHRPDDWAAEIGALLGASVVIESYGPRTADEKVRAGIAFP